MTAINMSGRVPHDLREACRCGSRHGVITTVGNQDVVRCADCDMFQYNAPRSETGRAVRSVRRTAIAPSKRARVLALHHNTCVACGARAPDIELTIGHLVPRQDAIDLGLPEHLADHDYNLAPMCPECNLGLGRSPVAIGLMYRLLVLHLRTSTDEEF